jgi:hypothetical protein
MMSLRCRSEADPQGNPHAIPPPLPDPVPTLRRLRIPNRPSGARIAVERVVVDRRLQVRGRWLPPLHQLLADHGAR